MRIENDIDAAGVFVFGQDFRPCFAAVSGAKNSALLIRTERVSQRRYENYVLISRIDNDRADLPAYLSIQRCPTFCPPSIDLKTPVP